MKFRLAAQISLLAPLLSLQALAAQPATATAAPQRRPAAAPAARRVFQPISPLIPQAKLLIQSEDWLGFRVFIKKAYWKPITYGDWFRIRGLVNAQGGNAGLDLINLWNYRNQNAKSNLDKTLEYADSLMMAERFNEAFAEYQKIAQYIKRSLSTLDKSKIETWQDRRRDLASLYPFVLHSMGRALYGAGRYEEAHEVYQWIPPNYIQFRQVLFERMWAAFRAGNVNWALGAIADQRASYFSAYLSPEAYLIQTYIYRKLCRTDDLNQVVAEMKRYQDALNRGSAVDWAGSDVETRVLWGLSRAHVEEDSAQGLVTRAEKLREQAEIRATLDRAFQKVRPKILADLKTVMAYAYIAGATDSAAVLKPVEKLHSREQLLKLDREVWPGDIREEWADEIGKHYFIGESLCGKKEHS